MSGIITPFNPKLCAKVGEISLYSAIGYLVTKIVTSVNPLAGAIYMGSAAAIRILAFHVFKDTFSGYKDFKSSSMSFKLVITLCSIPLAAYFANIVILNALWVEVISTVALLSLQFLPNMIS